MRRDTEGGPLESLFGIFNLGLIISGVALIGVTIYYVVATLSAGDQLFRAMGANGQPMPVADFQRHLGNMELLMKALLIAATVLTVCAIGRFYAYPETGIALIALGGLLFFGMPYLVDNYGGRVAKLPKALQSQKISDPRGFLKANFGLAGIGLAGAGGLVLLMHAAALVATARNRRPRANAEAQKTANQVRKPNDKFLGPCWDLPFCRDTEKKLCPIRQTKKPCWRKGRGCYCDQNVILTLSGGNQYAASRGSTGYMSAAAAAMAKPKSYTEKRAQCLQCPVYLHHQGQKHRVMAPGSLLAVVGAMAFYWGAILTGYPAVVRSVGKYTSGFAIGARAGEVPPWANELATNSTLMWILVLVVIMLIVSYLLHFVEWTLYKLGI